MNSAPQPAGVMLMAKYLVYIETTGDPITVKGPVAHVPSLPGATARGKTIDEAKENIRLAVQNYLSLLHNVGEVVPTSIDDIQFEFEVVERSTFVTDYDQLRPQEIDTLLRWMAISRQELMDILRTLSAEAMDWKFEEDDTRTLGDILCHLADSDLWYTDRLTQLPETPIYRLAATRGVALERLRSLRPQDFSMVTNYEGEDWTPRKIIRRMLEHEREHLSQIGDLVRQKMSYNHK
jgi:predicted RNase H-like HicB family nuclease